MPFQVGGDLMEEKTRKEIIEWLRRREYVSHYELRKGIELILRVLLEKEGL